MPGILKPDAICPVCGERLSAIVDTYSKDLMWREYFHGKDSPIARRKRRCKRDFESKDVYFAERRALEEERVAA